MQGRLLALLFLRPEAEYTVSQLTGRLKADGSTVHREVHRLSLAGIVDVRMVGRTRLVRAGRDPPYAPELGALVVKAFGPVPLLSEMLAGLEGVEEAHVYGSWAERYEGREGPAPGDIDVVIVGDPDRDRAYAIAAEAERILGLDVNITIRSPEAWRTSDEGFIRSVREGTLVPLREATA